MTAVVLDSKLVKFRTQHLKLEKHKAEFEIRRETVRKSLIWKAGGKFEERNLVALARSLKCSNVNAFFE